MNILFGFDIGDCHYARQLDLEKDGPALSALGQRCAAYLQAILTSGFNVGDAPRVFLDILRPRRVPAERSFVLGIFARPDDGGGPASLVGVLRFLHPDRSPGTWYIPLLLLEPAARGQGLGSALHAAFARWSAARGARRLVVAVSEANGQALHFWRDHLLYTEAASNRWQRDMVTCGCTLDLEHHLVPVLAAVPWQRMRV